MRVNADKLDELINLVGELVIASAGANLLARSSNNDPLQEAASTVSGLVEEILDGALHLRMIPSATRSTASAAWCAISARSWARTSN